MIDRDSTRNRLYYKGRDAIQKHYLLLELIKIHCESNRSGFATGMVKYPQVVNTSDTVEVLIVRRQKSSAAM